MLRWYGHVKRRPTEYVGNAALNLTISGKQRRGRPKLRWLSVVKQDMRSSDLQEDDVHDTAKWKQKIRRAVPEIS
ncbi:endonuclease-reverse transcriptase [Danaus plexippus plexippus]|uniref:Endonuclease-reverse transcriptase n=1 Tax=Danaus plexippus plexippus TaxID=278856 RepID=A0A212ETK9_DANPL|nr:endonuclease-reverse transcriptase [Danaus plexippus plexippus]